MASFGADAHTANPDSEVEIVVSFRHLPDIFKKSEAVCVLLTKDKTNKFCEYGRTETIQDSRSPHFEKHFIIDFCFEELQKLRFELYNNDSASHQLSQNDDAPAYLECSLVELVRAPGGTTTRSLHGNLKKKGKMRLCVEELTVSKEICMLQFNAMRLEKMDWFGKTSPALWFYRANEDESYTLVHKTEVIKNTMTPTWQPFTMPVKSLCQGDYDRSIKVECYDWNADGDRDLIGEFDTNLRTMLNQKESESENQYEVVNPIKKQKKKGYKNSGVVSLLACKVETQHSFLDYIKGGLQMQLTVAIDFTASNGNPKSATSLHYTNPFEMNQYTSTLTAVGEIIQDYDNNKLIRALGFGARAMDETVTHEFALNFDLSNPNCEGIEGVLQAYSDCLRKVELDEPAYFGPVINHVANYMVKDNSGSEKGNAAATTWATFSEMQQGIFYMHYSTMAFVAPVVEHWLEQEIAQWVHHMGLTFRTISGLCTTAAAPGVMGRQIAPSWSPIELFSFQSMLHNWLTKDVDGSQYFILLIITDGSLSDMPQTVEAIVNASVLPMSVIIVGVGSADFNVMNVLDGDNLRLSYEGKYAERNIVQFVPYGEFLNPANLQLSQAHLAKEVLSEIPTQVLSYMKKFGIGPRPPLARRSSRDTTVSPHSHQRHNAATTVSPHSHQRHNAAGSKHTQNAQSTSLDEVQCEAI